MTDKQPSHARRVESKSIIVCFDSRWEQHLRSRSIPVVFRKQAPRAFTPDWLYAYVTAPTSAVIARMPIRALEHMPVDEAVKLAQDGLLTEAELREYASPPFAAQWSKLFVYRVGQIQVAKLPITMNEMRDAWGYWPSSSFTPLVENAKKMIDRRGDFA